MRIVWGVVHCWRETTVASLWVTKAAAERHRKAKGILWRVKRLRVGL